MPDIPIDPLKDFLASIKSDETRKAYRRNLLKFLDFLVLKKELQANGDLDMKTREFYKRAKADLDWTTYWIIEWIEFQKMRVRTNDEDTSPDKIEKSTVKGFYKPVKAFCEENQIILNWKRIAKRLPSGRDYAKDRPPELEEIQKILRYGDPRIKVIVTMFVSAGIRLGAWDFLKVGDVRPYEINGKIMCGIVKVYTGEKEEYETCITLECYYLIQEYIEKRKSDGEKITAKSPLVRNLYKPDNNAKAEITQVRQLRGGGVKRVVEDAQWAEGIRHKLPIGKRRHEFQADHGFRKYHENGLSEHMEVAKIRMLQGQDTGLSQNYYSPRRITRELVELYLKAIPNLTITVEGRQTLELDKLADLK